MSVRTAARVVILSTSVCQALVGEPQKVLGFSPLWDANAVIKCVTEKRLELRERAGNSLKLARGRRGEEEEDICKYLLVPINHGA